MKYALAMVTVLGLSAAAWGVDAPGKPTVEAVSKNKPAKVEQAEAKAQKQAANQLQKVATKALAQPLAAQIIKVDAGRLTVKTQPMMGPDGLIEAKEKTYGTTNATVVVIDGTNKTLADLAAGAPARLHITADGKTVEQIESKTAAVKNPAKQK